MPREPDPINDEELYEGIKLAGQKSPGSVTLSGHDRKVNWTVNDGTAQVGATVVLKNIPLTEFTCTFYLADDDDIAAWPAFRALINTSVGSKAKALDIYHPDLASNDIHSVVKALIGGVVHDKKGGQTITVKFQEYKPPKPKKLTPVGSKSTPNDPDAAAKAQLAALTAQYQATPWG